MKAIIAPYSEQNEINYNSTVQNKVKLDFLAKYLPYNDIKDLKKIGTEFAVWGFSQRKDYTHKPLKSFLEYSKNDLVIFYFNKFFRRIFDISKLTISDELSYKLWNDKKYKYIVILSNEIEISYMPTLDDNITRFNYTFWVQSTVWLDELNTQNLLFKILENDLNRINFDKKFDYNKHGATTIKKFVNIRTEQSKIRDWLFLNKIEEKCIICKKKFPIKFLIAAHIKARAFCTEKERLDIKNIAAPMCKFGCDALYEEGYILVNEKGILVENFKNKYINDVIKRYADEFTNDEVLNYNEENKEYFAFNFKTKLN